MADEQLVVFNEKPTAKYLIAGWVRNWADGGDISSGLPLYLVNHLRARKVAEFTPALSHLCYPFQVAGTHDSFRPTVAYKDGLPTQPMTRQNAFYAAGPDLAIFLGEEPWLHLEKYAEAFFTGARELGIEQVAAVEGVNGMVPPDLERRVTCVCSNAQAREALSRYGVRFSSYGSEGRRGPTIGMALTTLAHYQYTDVSMFRFSALAPLYPFVGARNERIGISTDHRAFYDVMRRLKHLFKLDIDLSDLARRGETESNELQQILDRVAASNPGAKELIEQARRDYDFTPFVEPVDLDPALDSALQDILRGLGEGPQER